MSVLKPEHLEYLLAKKLTHADYKYMIMKSMSLGIKKMILKQFNYKGTLKDKNITFFLVG